MSESKCNDENRDVANSSIPGWAHIDFKDLELGDYLSGGGVGMVYKGWYKSEQVALKTLFDSRIGEDLKKEYMDELLVMSRVKHSNIVKFLGACMTPPNLCFVMEMCECSLYDILHVRREKLSEKDCVHMLTDVGAALEYLHAQKPAIIHRDVKSHNILRGFDGSLKLCDFGLVKVKSAQAGTPAYMAPELFENKSFNKSVDAFAFGVLMWEVFTAEVPFYLVDVAAIRERTLANNRPRVPSFGIPARCSELMRRCWAMRSDDRPDFGHIVDELLAVGDELPACSHIDSLSSGGDLLDSLLRK